MINYALQILIVINLYIILAVSLNLLVSYLGVISLSHAAFYGAGAYVYALLVTVFGWSFIPALIGSVGITLALSFLLSVSTLRLRADYLILTTLAFQLVSYDLLYNWVGLTNGPFGISGIPSPTIPAFTATPTVNVSVLTTLFAVPAVLLTYRLVSSPFGRVLKAIREDELMTKLLGKNTARFKITCFCVAASLAAVAGSLYSGFMRYIDPTSFTLNESVFILSIVIIGG
ncbi:MAG TPA: branched-chain amino acid ABC transporter permease, partial [Anaerolineales bacterium]|nr:branched-chain amino acid ABC transporter permease [Anaerolineales bacterium]